jgi:MerR family copper efflux transcriptional regulator
VVCLESPQHLIDIGEASRRVGISAAALRMYEKRGLLPKASRTSSGYRQYGHGDLQRARLVRRARRAGLSLAQIAQALGRDGEHVCMYALLRAHLDQLEGERKRIERLQRHLRRWMDARAEREPEGQAGHRGLPGPL